MTRYDHRVNTKTRRGVLALGALILVTATIALFYLMSVLFGLLFGWILASLLSAVAAMVWLVARILKDAPAKDKPFDEYCHQDPPEIRRNR